MIRRNAENWKRWLICCLDRSIILICGGFRFSDGETAREYDSLGWVPLERVLNQK